MTATNTLPQVRTLPVSQLREPAKNPNHLTPDKFAALVRVIAQLGFFQPVLVREVAPDDNGDAVFEIVDGVHRVRAARELGMVEVLAVVGEGLDAHRAVLAQLSMNRLRGELNLTESAELLSDLRIAGIADDALGLSGFNNAEVDDLLRSIAPPTTGMDLLDRPVGGTPAPAAPKANPNERPWLLGLRFKTEAEYNKVRKFLKRVGGGKDVDLADALVSLADSAGTKTRSRKKGNELPMYQRNAQMVLRGFVPANEAAGIVSKHPSTLHRMAQAEKVEHQRDGRALYISLPSLRQHYIDDGNAIFAELVAEHLRALADGGELDTKAVKVPRRKVPA
jgi:hypothetical protein